MKIDVTYIGHSGFLIEWDACYWLFDYYRGDIPELDPGKALIVFVSHRHGDHYNPDIFSLFLKHPLVTYVLSSDIKQGYAAGTGHDKGRIPGERIKSVKPSETYEIPDGDGNSINIKTLKSTDEGVGFLLEYMGKTIYHAGDLNLWVWKEESKQYNNNMTASFRREMAVLKDKTIDIAFAPLDPRQEEWYHMGLDELLGTARVRHVFPMHFWDQPDIIQKYKRERADNFPQTSIMDIKGPGQNFKLEI